MKRKSRIGNREHRNKTAYVFVFPYALFFSIFIVIPVVIAILLSFTNFNAIEFPGFVGFLNYINLLTNDSIFMQHVLPNTVVYAIIVGPGGYILSFLLSWALAQLTRLPRTIFALILYSPSLTSGVAMTVLWKVMFTGDQTGYINSWFME